LASADVSHGLLEVNFFNKVAITPCRDNAASSAYGSRLTELSSQFVLDLLDILLSTVWLKEILEKVIVFSVLL
jgi:hypothetical protein